MRRPPRRPDRPLFPLSDILSSLVLGAVGFAGVFAAYRWTMGLEDPATARATAFLMLMVMNAALILLTRIQRGRMASLFGVDNPLLWPVIAVVIAAAFLVTHLPALSGVLDFAPPRLDIAGLCAAAAFAGLLLCEAVLNVADRTRRRP